MASNPTVKPSQIPGQPPAKFNIYTKATDKKLTSSPITEAQVDDFKRRLTESSGSEVVVKQVLLG